MQDGGASIIELGVPYSDPQADGPTIQQANQEALQRGTSCVHDCLAMVQQAVEDARREGFKIIPLCPFAKATLQKHPEWQDVVQ